jgi:hypothetical protein
MAIVQNDQNVSVWLLANETGSDRYVTLLGDLEFISNPVNVLSAAQTKWEGQTFPSCKMVANSVTVFQYE